MLSLGAAQVDSLLSYWSIKVSKWLISQSVEVTDQLKCCRDSTDIPWLCDQNA